MIKNTILLLVLLLIARNTFAGLPKRKIIIADSGGTHENNSIYRQTFARMKIAADLALKHFKTSHKLKFEPELEFHFKEGEPEWATVVIHKAASDPNRPIVVGFALSGTAAIASSEANRTGVFVLSPTSSLGLLTKGPFFKSLGCPIEELIPFVGDNLSRHVKENPSSIGIVYSKDLLLDQKWIQGLQSHIRHPFDAFPLNSDSLDFSPVLHWVESRPQANEIVVFFPGFTMAGLRFIKHLGSTKRKVRLMGPPYWAYTEDYFSELLSTTPPNIHVYAASSWLNRSSKKGNDLANFNTDGTLGFFRTLEIEFSKANVETPQGISYAIFDAISIVLEILNQNPSITWLEFSKAFLKDRKVAGVHSTYMFREEKVELPIHLLKYKKSGFFPVDKLAK